MIHRSEDIAISIFLHIWLEMLDTKKISFLFVCLFVCLFDMFKVNDADAAAGARPQEDENADGAVALDEAKPEAGAVAQPLLRWNTDAVEAALPGDNI